MTTRKRRSPGEGSVWEYREKNGTVRYAIGHPSFGTRRRGPNGQKWFTRKDAQAALRVMLTDTERGELTDPSKQPLGTYLATWLDGHPDIGESTRASYAKNIRAPLDTNPVTEEANRRAMNDAVRAYAAYAGPCEDGT